MCRLPTTRPVLPPVPTMKTTTLATFLFATLLTATAQAQLAGPGLNWLGTVSGGAGSYAPSCTVLPVAAIRGEGVTLRVWGDVQSPFALFAAGSTTSCTPFPGIGNGLLLGQPIITVTFGLLTQFSPCLSCPPGYQAMNFSIPATVPPNTMVAFQAAGYGNQNLSFTVALAATVQ
jgi:hypothetical protein